MYAHLSHSSFVELRLKSSGSPFRFPKVIASSRAARATGHGSRAAILALLAFLDVEINVSAPNRNSEMGTKRK